MINFRQGENQKTFGNLEAKLNQNLTYEILIKKIERFHIVQIHRGKKRK